MLSFRNSTKQLADSRIDTAIISVGSTEQFGPNLPMHGDTLLAEYFARTYGEALNAYVLPTLPFNCSEEHASFRGTIIVRPTTIMAMLEEIVAQLREQGFRKQVLLVGHRSSWLVAFIKDVNWRFKDIVVVNAHPAGDRMWDEVLEQAGPGGRNELHGGAISRALALYLCPECVLEGEFGEVVPRQMLPYQDYCGWDRITAGGSWGSYSAEDAAIATTATGKALLEAFVARSVPYLQTHLEEACRLKGI